MKRFIFLLLLVSGIYAQLIEIPTYASKSDGFRLIGPSSDSLGLNPGYWMRYNANIWDLENAIITVNFQNTAYRWGVDEINATVKIEGEILSDMDNDLEWTPASPDDNFVTLDGAEFKIMGNDSLLYWDTSLDLYKKASVYEVLSGDIFTSIVVQEVLLDEDLTLGTGRFTAEHIISTDSMLVKNVFTVGDDANNTSGKIDFISANNSKGYLLIDDSDRLGIMNFTYTGINTMSPAYLFDVNGDMRVVGTSFFNNILSIVPSADNLGIRVYGYDDQSASYSQIHYLDGINHTSTGSFNFTSSSDFYINLGEALGVDALIIRDSDLATRATIDSDGNASFSGTFALGIGTTINEISTDVNMVGNSNDAVPTEKAVKTYADAVGAAQSDNQTVDLFSLVSKELRLSVERDGEVNKTVDLTGINETHTGNVTGYDELTLAVINTPIMTLGGDADGDIYFRSSNVLARLSKGSAGEVLKMNAAETTPEWTELVIVSPSSNVTGHGIKVTFTNGNAEDVNFGDVCYMVSDGDLEFADASAAGTMPALYMAMGTITAGQSGTWLKMGFVRKDAWTWTVGGLIYVSLTGTTGNTLTQTAPSAAGEQVQIIGIATHADRIDFNPNLMLIEIVTI